MSELGRVLRVDARRSAPLVAVPTLTGIGTTAAWLSLLPGVAYWDNTVVALVNAVRILGPVAAGLAAWTAVRERPLDYLRDLTARSPAIGALFDLLLLSAAGLLSYGSITLVIVIVTLLRLDAGRPDLLGVVAGAAAFVLHIVVGYLAGRAVPHRATPAAVVIATFLWAALRVPGGSWWSLLPPAGFDHVELFTGLRPDVLADQAVWALGGTAALVLGYVACVTRRVLTVLPLFLALAATVTATLGLHGSGGRTVSPAPAGPVCREWPLTVCVHPALREALPTLMAALTPLAGRLNGTPGAFTRVEQHPAWAPATVADGVAVIHLDDDLSAGYEARAVGEIRDGLVDHKACAAPRRPSAAAYRSLVDAWLAGENLPVIPDGRAARSFASWNEDRRRVWLRRHYADYRYCALRPTDFPTRASQTRAGSPPRHRRPGAPTGTVQARAGSPARPMTRIPARPRAGAPS